MAMRRMAVPSVSSVRPPGVTVPSVLPLVPDLCCAPLAEWGGVAMLCDFSSFLYFPVIFPLHPVFFHRC